MSILRKKIFSKIPFFAVMIALCIPLSSCHDNIYGMIEMEVVQETGINGDISKIVPFNGNLWFTNRKLYKKDATPSDTTGKYNNQWSLVEAKCNDVPLEQIITLASDGSYLYCYTIEWKESTDDSVFTAYRRRFYSSTDGETWTQIDVSSVTGSGDSSDSYIENSLVATIFDNKAGDGGSSFSGRKAFAKLWNPSGGAEGKGALVVYELNGTSLGSATDAASTVYNSVYFNGSTIFGDCMGMAANGTHVYKTSGSSVQYSSDGSTWESVDFGKGIICTIALTADYIIFGTTSGVYRAALNSGVPSSELTDFTNNAQSLLTSRVTGLYVLDSSKNDGESDEYGSMNIVGYLSSSADTFKEVGLYAYYPGRGVWNRDGD